jgi:hypothetical protein
MTRVDEAQLRAHVRAINDCNQRGGRMLSLVDLIEARTVDLPLASYLAATMRHGASLLVGANPGGAGKTAVMCALLNFLPNDTMIRPVSSPAVLASVQDSTRRGQVCYLAHEIGAGSYYAYVWGREARAFLQMPQQGHSIASNLHADTLQETYEQLCDEVGARRADVGHIELKVYLGVKRTGGWSMQRWVNRVYEARRGTDHLLWQGNASGVFRRHSASAIVDSSAEQTYAGFLQEMIDSSTRRFEAVRRALLEAHLPTASLLR